MFPGQGSQSIGMMASLLNEFDVARQVFKEASEAIGVDLTTIASEGPEAIINQTAITQPIVLTASIAMWRVWESQTEVKPDFVCGHSLGEYTALVASGVLTLKDAVRLVHLRGSLMQDAVPLGEGGMAAILGLDEASVEQACKEAEEGAVVAAANYNSPGQVVISGETKALERAMVIAKDKGAKRVAKLPVSVPCHCDLLKPAGESLAQELEKIQFKPLLIPIVQNVNATDVSDLSELKTNLLAHLHRPVLWSQSITALVHSGAQIFIECGPGKVLAGLNKRIDKSVKTMNMNDSESMAKVLAEIEAA